MILFALGELNLHGMSNNWGERMKKINIKKRK